MFKGHTVGRVAASDISGHSDTLTRDDGAQMWRKSTQMLCQRVDVSEGRSVCLLCQSSSLSNMKHVGLLVSFSLNCGTFFETRNLMN